jgi:hypothetical protein
MRKHEIGQLAKSLAGELLDRLATGERLKELAVELAWRMGFREERAAAMELLPEGLRQPMADLLAYLDQKVFK